MAETIRSRNIQTGELVVRELTQAEKDKRAPLKNRKLPLLDRLQKKIDSLPDDAMAAYAPLIGSVESLIKMGRPGAVRALIQGANLVDPSHEPLRAALLAEFE